jgi:hypothetical protein
VRRRHCERNRSIRHHAHGLHRFPWLQVSIEREVGRRALEEPRIEIIRKIRRPCALPLFVVGAGVCATRQPRWRDRREAGGTRGLPDLLKRRCGILEVGHRQAFHVRRRSAARESAAHRIALLGLHLVAVTMHAAEGAFPNERDRFERRRLRRLAAAPDAIARDDDHLLPPGHRQTDLHSRHGTPARRPCTADQDHVGARLAQVHLRSVLQARGGGIVVILVGERRRDLYFGQCHCRPQRDRRLDDHVQRVDAEAIGQHGERGFERCVVLELQHASPPALPRDRIPPGGHHLPLS